MAKSKKNQEVSDEAQVQGGAQAELEEDTVKQRVVAKLRAGDFTFPQDLAWGIAKALGVEEELDPANFGQAEEGASPTAGSTPATGSGGTPYRPDAAHEDTKKAAKDAEKRLDKGEYEGNDHAQAVAKGNDRRLVEAVKEEK